jgi:hypothetical protein
VVGLSDRRDVVRGSPARRYRASHQAAAVTVICWTGSAARCPRLRQGCRLGAARIAAAVAEADGSAKGRRVGSGHRQHPGNGVEPQWDATIRTAWGSGWCSTRLNCGRGSSRRPGYPTVGAAGQIRESRGKRPGFLGRAFRGKSGGHRRVSLRGVGDTGRRRLMSLTGGQFDKRAPRSMWRSRHSSVQACRAAPSPTAANHRGAGTGNGVPARAEPPMRRSPAHACSFFRPGYVEISCTPRLFAMETVSARRDSLSWPQDGGLKWPPPARRRGVVVTV